MTALSPYRDEFLLKLRSNGDFAWARNAGGGLIATDDSGNVVLGVQKLDSSGNSVWTGRWAGMGNDRIKSAWMGLDKKDTIYITGTFSGTYVDFDPALGTFYLSCLPYATQSGFILKLNQIPNPYIPNGINEASQRTDVSVYPNPSSGIITFSSPFTIHRIELRDITGKVVYVAEPAKAKTIIDLGSKAAGVYFYEVDCEGGKQRGKLVIY